MTLEQALSAVLQVPGIEGLTLEKALTDADLTISAMYDKSNEQAIDKVAVAILQSLIVAAESEGGFSYSISQAALQTRIQLLQSKWDDTISTAPKVRGVRVW